MIMSYRKLQEQLKNQFERRIREIEVLIPEVRVTKAVDLQDLVNKLRKAFSLGRRRFREGYMEPEFIMFYLLNKEDKEDISLLNGDPRIVAGSLLGHLDYGKKENKPVLISQDFHLFNTLRERMEGYEPSSMYAGGWEIMLTVDGILKVTAWNNLSDKEFQRFKQEA